MFQSSGISSSDSGSNEWSSSEETGGACHKPFVYLTDTAMVIVWNIMYWFSFVMCWAVYPFLETYAVSGYFTRCERAKESLRSNALFYGICGVLGVVGYVVLLLVGKASVVNPMPVLMSLGNAWGLLLLLLLLGYGLVEIPRSLWRSAHYRTRLDRCRFEIVAARKKLLDARDGLAESVGTLKRYTEKVGRQDPFWHLIEQIVSEVPAALFRAAPAGSGKVDVYYDSIVALRYKLHNRLHEVSIMEDQYNGLVQEAFDIESILRAKSGDARRDTAVDGGGSAGVCSPYFVGVRWTERVGPDGTALPQPAWLVRVVQWLWFVYLRQPVLAVAALLLGAFSCVVVWCECFFFFDRPVLSLFALIFRSNHADAAELFPFLSNDITLTVMLSIPLLYIMFCSYWSLFKIQLFSYYRLLPHQSDPYSLLFSAAYLTRLCSPLTLNFLHMCKFSGTSFQKVMSNMETMPFLGGTSFNYYAPIILLLLCLCEIFNIIPRILSCLRIKRRFLYSDTRSLNRRVVSTIEEGKKLLDAERENWMAQSPHSSPAPFPPDDQGSGSVTITF